MKVSSNELSTALPVPVAPGIAFPAEVTVTAEDCQGYDVVIVVVPAAGRLVARSVEVRQRDDGPPVTGEAIRAVPVAGLVRQASGHVLSVDSTHPDGQAHQLSRRTIDKAGVERLRQAGPTDETLDWVAYIYRLALMLGTPPTGTVERDLELPRSTAGRWVAMARERGFLGQSEGPGKAGG